MFVQSISRRHFMGGLATAGATAAALAVEASQGPVVVTAFPVTEPKPAAERIRIVCAERLTPDEVQKIASVSPNVDFVLAQDRADLAGKGSDAEVILGTVNRETIQAARRLKWVQTWAAGVETLPKELMEHPCVLTNMQRVFAPVIAETAIALMLSLTRGLAQHAIPNFRLRKWEREKVPLEDLYGKTLGIVGLGGIGSETARRAYYGFGMRILAVDAKPLPKPEYVETLREPGWLMEMIPQVDVLMSAAPLTQETRGLFNDAVFQKMKPSAYFINVSRGGLVDQEALARALQGGLIRGAGLDVTTPEPLPPEHPLWNCPNLAITPHNSGSAPIRQVRLIALVAENVRRYSLGLPLLNVVDKARGY